MIGGGGGHNSGDTTIQYGSGAVAGPLASDKVSFGGFTVSSQTFRAYLSFFALPATCPNLSLFPPVLASEVTQDLLQGPVSGLMGLAFESIASTDSVPFWQALVNRSGSRNVLPRSFQVSFGVVLNTDLKGCCSIGLDEP